MIVNIHTYSTSVCRLKLIAVQRIQYPLCHWHSPLRFSERAHISYSIFQTFPKIISYRIVDARWCFHPWVKRKTPTNTVARCMRQMYIRVCRPSSCHMQALHCIFWYVMVYVELCTDMVFDPIRVISTNQGEAWWSLFSVTRNNDTSVRDPSGLCGLPSHILNTSSLYKTYTFHHCGKVHARVW